MQILRRIIQPVSNKPHRFIQTQKEIFRKSYFIINIYYSFIFYTAVNYIWYREKWLASKSIFPLWPLFWVNESNYAIAVNCIIISAIFSSLLCLLFHQKRFLRVLVFLTLLLLVTLENSFGKVNHGNHVLIYISFILIFLPNKNKREIESSPYQRQLYLNAFFTSQVIFMLTYSLSGFWKILTGLQQFMKDEINCFSPDALALLIYKRIHQTNVDSLLGGYIIDHPFLGWPLYISAIFLEFFSVVAAFRPSVHRIWGVFLITLHLSIYLTMTINFKTNMFLLLIFFVFSPFYMEGVKMNNVIRNLPVILSAIKSVKYLRSRLS